MPLIKLTKIDDNDEEEDLIVTVKYYVPIKGVKKRIKRTKTIDKTNTPYIITVDEDGFLHSFDDKPAYTAIYSDFAEWWNHGELHREGDKPAKISKDINYTWSLSNFTLSNTREEYYLNNVLYKEIVYDYKGNIK